MFMEFRIFWRPPPELLEVARSCGLGWRGFAFGVKTGFIGYRGAILILRVLFIWLFWVVSSLFLPNILWRISSYYWALTWPFSDTFEIRYEVSILLSLWSSKALSVALIFAGAALPFAVVRGAEKEVEWWWWDFSWFYRFGSSTGFWWKLVEVLKAGAAVVLWPGCFLAPPKDWANVDLSGLADEV